MLKAGALRPLTDPALRASWYWRVTSRPRSASTPPGHVWGTLIKWLTRPEIGVRPAKPPGLRPVLPPSIDNGLPPNGGQPPHPWLPGRWEPIDPGFGKPPAWGRIGVDNGFAGASCACVGERSWHYALLVHPGNRPPGGAWLPTSIPALANPSDRACPLAAKPHLADLGPGSRPSRQQLLPPEGSGGYDHAQSPHRHRAWQAADRAAST